MSPEPPDLERLQSAQNIWLATVRPNGTPHLVPIWFVWLDNSAFICTGRSSVKGRNMLANPRVAFALEDGNDPLVIQAEAQLVTEITPAVVAAFQQKYDWRIVDDAQYNAVFRLNPTRVLL